MEFLISEFRSAEGEKRKYERRKVEEILSIFCRTLYFLFPIFEVERVEVQNAYCEKVGFSAEEAVTFAEGIRQEWNNYYSDVQGFLSLEMKVEV